MRRITRGDVAIGLSAVALFTAAGGPAEAARTINGALLKPKSVSASKLRDRTITAAKLKDRTITGSKLADGTVTGTQLGTASVGASELAPGAVGTGALANDGVTQQKLAPAAVGAAELAPDAVGSGAIALGGVRASDLAASGTALVNFPTIPARECADATIAVSGVGGSIADAIPFAVPDTAFAGYYTHQVERAGTGGFVVKVCNLGAIPNGDPDGAGGSSWRWAVLQP